MDKNTEVVTQNAINVNIEISYYKRKAKERLGVCYVLLIICLILFVVCAIFGINEWKLNKKPYLMFLTKYGKEEPIIQKILSYKVVKNWIPEGGMFQIKKHIAMEIAKDIIKEKGGNLSNKYKELRAEMASNDSKQSDYYLQIAPVKEDSIINMTYSAETKGGRKVSGDVDMHHMINFSEIKKIEIIPLKVLELRYDKGIRLEHLSNMMKGAKDGLSD